MNFLSLMQNRYTTKYYDPNKKISKDDIDSLLECLRLTPSSVNCQPWHFYVAGDESGKAKIRGCVLDFNLQRFDNCSHVIAICGKTKVTEEHFKKVLDKEENPESILIAFIRNLAKFLNIITLGLGFLICAATKKKQTLGDLVTKTYVVTDIKISDKDERPFSNPFKRLCAFILDLLVLALILYGINWLLIYFTGLNISEDLNIIIDQITIPLTLLIVLLYFPLIESRKGTTFGKNLLRIKMITLNDKKPGFFRLLFKQIILLVEIITLGFLLAIVTPKRQTLSNRLSKTVVVDM